MIARAGDRRRGPQLSSATGNSKRTNKGRRRGMRHYWFKTPLPEGGRPEPQDRDRPEYKIAFALFDRLRASFPGLAMTLDEHDEHLDLALDIPVQDGLQFEVHLNLQNVDELHLCVAGFWCSWFPCSEPKCAAEFFEAVSGLLSGHYRILEHRRGTRVVKTQLQRPLGDGWRTVATSAPFPSLPWPRKTYNIVQNSVG